MERFVSKFSISLVNELRSKYHFYLFVSKERIFRVNDLSCKLDIKNTTNITTIFFNGVQVEEYSPFLQCSLSHPPGKQL